jgi:hypothetical protein
MGVDGETVPEGSRMADEVKTTAELNAALAALPEFSRKVYETIKAGQYAEPGFSDVMVTDVATVVGAARKAVNAAVGHLIEVGLVYTTEGSSRSETFLHTYEHDNEIAR